MYSKFSNIVLALLVIFSFGVMNNAKAGLIIGSIYSDGANVQWQYIGSFDLTGYIDPSGASIIAPWWKLSPAQYATANAQDYGALQNDNYYYAHPLNGITAAIRFFGAGNYALSTTVWSANSTYVINHKAYYDTVNGSTTDALSESLSADNNGDGMYKTLGDKSAFIQDRNAFAGIKVLGGYGAHINNVFKRVAVPEPSTLAIFALALIALSTRRLKRK